MTDVFYGKYRGLVLSNIDPMQLGRLLVQVPDVAGLLHELRRRLAALP